MSIYRDVRRLPAANYIQVKSDRIHIRPYWVLPQYGEAQARNDAEYTDQFQKLLGAAVGDRSRADRIAIELSGGMDSTSVAVVAASAAKVSGRLLTAYTRTCQKLLPDDQEGDYAAMVAAHLHLPVVFQPIDGYALFERCLDSELRTAEPCENPIFSGYHDFVTQVAGSGTRVLLTGQGGDALLEPSSNYFADLLRNGRIDRLLAEVYRHVSTTGSIRGMGLRSALLGPPRPPQWQRDFPDWVDAAFAKRTQLRDRWEAGWRTINESVGNYHQLRAPWVNAMFGGYDALRSPLVVRHPLFDLRLVSFLLTLPDYLKSGKRIVRQSMRGKLPEAVRTRPKTTLAGDNIRAKFAEKKSQIPVESLLTLVAGRYVDRARYLRYFEKYLAGEGTESTYSSHYIVSPMALNIWLTQHPVRNHQV